MRRSRVLAAFAVLVLLVALGVTMLARVPPGMRAAGSRGWLDPGWHLRPPLSALTTVAESSELTIALDAQTPSGASRAFEVRARYTIPAGDAASALASRVRVAGGLGPALTPVLSETLGAAMRDAKGGPPRRGTSTDPIGSALVARLRGTGLTVEGLEWRRTDAAPGPPVVALRPPARKKILVVGLDAADWEIIDPLIAQGKLPHLARLVKGGARAPLRSYDPMISPLIWTTMVTGVGPDTHGIADFLVTDEATGRPMGITSRFRRVKALWNIFSDAGLRSGFVGWWASFPAEPVDGYLVTDLMGFSLLAPGAQTNKTLPGVTHPSSYYAEIRPKLILPDAVGLDDVRRFVKATPAEYQASLSYKPASKPTPGGPVGQDPVWLVRRTLAVTRNYETIALDLLRRDLDVVGVYFEGIDMMGHRFQHCLPPRMSLCPDAEYEKEQGAVTAFYEYQDEVLGRLVAAAPGRVVVVVSDHGFRNGADRPPEYAPYTTGQPVEWHREYGVLALSGPGVRAGVRLASASVYDVAPTLLYLSGLPEGEDMPGRVLTDALDVGELAAHPPRRIPSFEDAGSARPVGEAALSPEAQQEMVESLQALGYVGPLPAAPGGDRGAGAEGRAPASGTAAARLPGSGESTRVTYHRNLATFYMKSGRSAEAEAELVEANRLEPLPKTYGMLSEIRAGRGDFDGAVAILEEGLGRFPEMDEESVLWMIDLRLRQNRPDLAVQALDRYRARITRPALLATCEGKLAAARGDEDRAIGSFLEALHREPALVQAAVAVAPLLDARGRLAELEPDLRRALAAERRIDEYQNLIGVILLQKGRPAEALASIGEALDVDPSNPRFLENFAAAALTARRPELGMARYQAAIADPRAGGPTWSGYGRLLGLTKHPAQAADAFAKAISLGDTTPATYAGYATALLQSGAKDRARSALREGLRAWPGDPALTALERQAG